MAIRTFKILFWLGVCVFLSGATFQVAGRLTALEAQSDLDRQPGGETVPDWIGKSYGGEMVFVGAISAVAAAFGWLLVSRRRRESQLEDFNGDVPLDFFDKLKEETDAYIVGKGISNP